MTLPKARVHSKVDDFRKELRVRTGSKGAFGRSGSKGSYAASPRTH